MSLGDHIRRNWVEYLLLGIGVFFLSKNKKTRKLFGLVLKKAKNQVKALLDEPSKGK